ncbi:MAG TPA: histone deacetylase [Candidatus Binatia bacterium]|nr:histone deacetylase [Candidatus Binatia bacterium]
MTGRNTALYYDPLFLGHDTLDHIESAARVQKSIELLETSGVADRMARPACRDATEEELLRVHAARHIERMRHVAADGPVLLLPDTVANTGTYAAARRAAGACVAAAEAVWRGEFESAYCLIRPPGHHAVAAMPMGFCFFNNVAIAAAHARAALGIERVAIVDIDIHHGNGTQDAFYEDGSVLYISTHQYPYYPGTGHWRETGAGAGTGATLNVPLPGGCGDAEYGLVFDDLVEPALRRFRPGLVLVSAGYDAHHADPIDGAEMRLSCAGYASLIRRLKVVAGEVCEGRMVVALEGGYNLTALSWAVRNSCEVLLGEEPSPDPIGPAPPRTAPDITALVAAIRDLHRL